MIHEIREGDCVEQMRNMQDNSIDSIVTDPPYGLGFMGKAWDIGVPAVEVFEEALRVLKPGGHLLAFGGSRTYHRLAVAVEDAGFEIRDQIMWVYGSGFPKSKNLDGDWKGWGTALKPAHEPIVVARKPLIGTVAANVMEWGTGALNIDGCRVGTGEDKGVWPVTQRRHNDVAWTVQPVETDTTQGRWPANLIHDGSDEVVGLFPVTKSGARNGPNPNATKALADAYDGGWKQTGGPCEASSGSAARFFYSAKASKRDRGEGNTHPTVKPNDLMRYLCRLVTPPGGVILDPFCGSGSTGKAAIMEGFAFIGIERDEEYAALARKRIAETRQHDGDLFA